MCLSAYKILIELLWPQTNLPCERRKASGTHTHLVAPSIALLACLLQAFAYQPGLVWASQKCNRWRHKACIPNTDGEVILHHLIDVYNINVTINQIMYLSCTTVATCCQVFSESWFIISFSNLKFKWFFNIYSTQQFTTTCIDVKLPSLVLIYIPCLTPKIETKIDPAAQLAKLPALGHMGSLAGRAGGSIFRLKLKLTYKQLI